MSETIQHLMQPRILVIADYPGNPFEVGSVLNFEKRGKPNVITWYESDGERRMFLYEFEPFPHLFRKLEWWEYRSIEDFPRFLKRQSDKKVFEVQKHWATNGEKGGWLIEPSMFIRSPDGIGQAYWAYQPATEADYNEYLKSTSK